MIGLNQFNFGMAAAGGGGPAGLFPKSIVSDGSSISIHTGTANSNRRRGTGITPCRNGFMTTYGHRGSLTGSGTSYYPVYRQIDLNGATLYGPNQRTNYYSSTGVQYVGSATQDYAYRAYANSTKVYYNTNSSPSYLDNLDSLFSWGYLQRLDGDHLLQMGRDITPYRTYATITNWTESQEIIPMKLLQTFSVGAIFYGKSNFGQQCLAKTELGYAIITATDGEICLSFYDNNLDPISLGQPISRSNLSAINGSYEYDAGLGGVYSNVAGDRILHTACMNTLYRVFDSSGNELIPWTRTNDINGTVLPGASRALDDAGCNGVSLGDSVLFIVRGTYYVMDFYGNIIHQAPTGVSGLNAKVAYREDAQRLAFIGGKDSSINVMLHTVSF